MTAIVQPTNAQTINPSFNPITPYQLYMFQVKGIMDAIRAQTQNLDYLPPQFGGIQGQRAVLEENVVLQNIDFKIN